MSNKKDRPSVLGSQRQKCLGINNFKNKNKKRKEKTNTAFAHKT